MRGLHRVATQEHNTYFTSTVPHLKEYNILEPPEYGNYYLSLSSKSVKFWPKSNKMLV